MVQTAFYSVAKPLVVLHNVAAIVLVGASTHHFLIALGYLRGRYKVRLGRIHAATVAITYLTATALGALAYPTYRYFVRAIYLDRYAPWASNLFDIKENLATIGLPLAFGAWALSRTLDPENDRAWVTGYFAMVSLVNAIVWFNVIAGILVTMTRGIQ